MRKSIPTVYANTRFRSKLEADWARCFDRVGVAWEYEREGLYCGDVFVLPDFWLPLARQYFEVKAIMTDADVLKFTALCKKVGSNPYPARDFVVFGWPDGVLSFARAYQGQVAFCSDDVALVECDACHVRYFLETDQGWCCPHCRRDGDNVRWIRNQEGKPDYRWPGWPVDVASDEWAA